MLGMSKGNGTGDRPTRPGAFTHKPRHWAYAKAENPLGSFVPF